MFYLDVSEMEPNLRFGDVIQGFPICYPVVNNSSDQSGYNIAVSAPTFAVVLSPCCSISDKMLAIAPLQQLENKLYANPFFAEDPSRINIKVPPDLSVPPVAWENMPAEKKGELLSKGDSYVFVDKFVYKSNDLFPKYSIHRKTGKIETNYMILDFRTSVKISCSSINDPSYSVGPNKILQLTVEARDSLRKKIASFYIRMPKEDAAFLAS